MSDRDRDRGLGSISPRAASAVAAALLVTTAVLVGLSAEEALAAPMPNMEERRAAGALTRDLGPGFSVIHTEHFQVAHDGERNFARFHGDLFEAVYTAFHEFFATGGFQLTPPKGPLQAVLFAKRSDFDAFAATHGHLESASGFFSLRTNRVAFFDAYGEAGFGQASERIRGAQDKLNDTRSKVRRSKSDRMHLSFSDGSGGDLSKSEALELLRHKNRELNLARADLFESFEERDLTTTIHECVHQLAFNLGIQNPRADNPTWLAEGLATYFETVGYADVGTSGLRNPQRHGHFLDAQKRGELIPLSELLSDDSVFSGDRGRRLTAYAQSWALVHYLLERKPKKFFRYLEAVATTTPKGKGPRDLESFHSAFGKDLADLETTWHQFMQEVR